MLASGTWEAITWLRVCLGDQALREWIERHRGGGLSPRQLRFWELMLNLPHRQVSAWLWAEGRKIWDQRVKWYREREANPMKLKVLIHSAEEGGFWAEVPALPGCVSEGDTLEETLANIREAAEGWLEVATERVTADAQAQIVEIDV